MDNQIYYIKKYLKCKVCDGVGVTPFTEFKGHTVGGTNAYIVKVDINLFI